MGAEETRLDREIAQWKGFECVFYQDDRLLFDKMMSEAKQYVTSFEASGRQPSEALFMTLIFQQQKIIGKLLAAIDYLADSKTNKEMTKQKG